MIRLGFSNNIPHYREYRFSLPVDFKNWFFLKILMNHFNEIIVSKNYNQSFVSSTLIMASSPQPPPPLFNQATSSGHST